MGFFRNDGVYIYQWENTWDGLYWMCSFSQEIDPLDKKKKGKQNPCSCTFFDVKVLQRNMRRGLFLCVLGQLQMSIWLHLPEDWKRKRRFWVSGYCTHVYTKCGNYLCSLIFPTASLLLAKQMFLTGYCLAVCKHLLPEMFPRVWRFLVHHVFLQKSLAPSVTPILAHLIWKLHFSWVPVWFNYDN